MIARLRADAAEQDGFSLMELLASMVIGSLVLAALMTIFITGVKGTTGIQNRVDNSQRARVAMDGIVSLLDSEVCVPQSLTTNIATPPVIAGSTASSMTFYADLNGAGVQPNKYTITYDPATRKITQDTYNASGNAPGRTFFSGKTTRVLATDIAPATDVNGVAQPVFTYYTYVASGSETGTVRTTGATVPLSASDAAATVRIRVQFQAFTSPSRTDDNRQHAPVIGYGTVSTYNPDSTSPRVCP